MFKLFDKFRTPAPTREDIEQSRIYKKDLYDAAAHAILQEMIKKNQVKIPKPIPFDFLQFAKSKEQADFMDLSKPFDAPKFMKHIKPPKPKIPLVLVPLHDYEIIKIIRLGWALGEGTTQLPIEESGYTEDQENETHYNNAKMLYKFYGIPKDRIFQLTGCVLNDDI